MTQQESLQRTIELCAFELARRLVRYSKKDLGRKKNWPEVLAFFQWLDYGRKIGIPNDERRWHFMAETIDIALEMLERSKMENPEDYVPTNSYRRRTSLSEVERIIYADSMFGLYLTHFEDEEEEQTLLGERKEVA